MEIVNVGYNSRHDKNFSINRPYGSGDYILLLLRSPAYFILKGERQHKGPNSAIIFKKGTPQLYGALNEEYVNDWLHFELTDLEEEMLSSLGIPFDEVFSVYNAMDVAELIKRMFNEKYSLNMHKDESLELCFKLILRKLSEALHCVDSKKENEHYQTFLNLRNEIYLTPGTDWSLETICEKINLSCSYVQHLYKDFFGRSLLSDVTAGRLGYAKYLLSSTDMSVSEIATSCGYKNDVHFMRTFKKEVGETPSQYRKRLHIKSQEMVASKNRNPYVL